MSEDYKKIALEDVKKGQRVRIVNQYPSHIATYEGEVVRTNIDRDEIELGVDGSELPIYVDDSAYLGGRFTEILLLREDVSNPKEASTDTVTSGATYFEYNGVLRFASVEQWNRHEERFRDKWLKDSDGDVWAYINGKWQYWCSGSAGYWFSDTPIEEYAEEGFTIVDGLD